MNIQINPTLIEDIQGAIERFAKDNKRIIQGADDQTNTYRNIFKEFEDASFNEIRDIYYYIELPHELHATLHDHWMDMKADLGLTTYRPEEKSEEEHALQKQDVHLYICDRAPRFDKGNIQLGMRLLHVTWSALFRAVPYGISKIELSVNNAGLENPERLPLILKIVEECTKIPSLKNED